MKWCKKKKKRKGLAIYHIHSLLHSTNTYDLVCTVVNVTFGILQDGTK